MNRYILIRRLRWPAIVLLAGVIALLRQMGAIDHFWNLFIPLLLIMLGILLLAERMALSAEEAAMPNGPYSGYGNMPYPNAPYQGAPYGAQPVAAEPQPPASTSIVPASHDFENDPNGGQS